MVSFLLNGSGKSCTVHNTSTQRYLVCVFQLVTNGYPTGKYAQFDTHFLKFTVNIKIRGIPFHGCA